MKFCATLVVFCVLVAAYESALQPTQTYQYENVLIQSRDGNTEPQLKLYWSYDDKDITFELHARNLKTAQPLTNEFQAAHPGVAQSNVSWILFGVKNDNQSLSIDADVIVSFIKEDGVGHFSDRLFERGNVRAVRDKDGETNIFLQDAFNKEGITVVKYKRPIDICGERNTDDILLKQGEVELVFQMGNLYKNNDYYLTHEQDKLESKRIELMKPNGRPFICPMPMTKELGPEPTSKYLFKTELMESVYRLYWNFTDTQFIGEVHVKTKGWVAFGLSPNGGMDGADVMVAWIDDVDGSTHFTDRFIRGKQVQVDTSQDWVLLGSKQVDGYTIIKFRRPIKLCNDEDRVIETGAPYVIYAFGNADPPKGGDISYHGISNRGSTVINLISSYKETEINEELDTFDIIIQNVVLPRTDTYYYVHGFNIPPSLEKHHILKWEILLPKYNLARMHHALLYESAPDFVGQIENAPGDVDYERNKGYTTSLGWAIGAKDIVIYPEGTGYPIGGDTNYKYLSFELHYDNPGLDIGYVEQIGIRFYITKNLRKNELGILTVGAVTAPYAIFIPPGIDRFELETYCSKDCTNIALDGEVTLLSALPHTHLTGIAVSTRHIRNGEDIGFIHKIDNYDFNYQQDYSLPNLVFKKGDELITKCTYRTKSRSRMTFGGLGTPQEMCLNFLVYYPRRSTLSGCLSLPNQPKMFDFLSELNKTGEVEMPASGANFNPAYSNYYAIMSLENKPISESLKEKLVDYSNKSPYSLVCGTEFFQGPLNKIVPKNTFVEKSVCDAKPTETTFFQKVATFFTNIFKSLFGWLFRN